MGVERVNVGNLLNYWSYIHFSPAIYKAALFSNYH